MTDPAWLSSSPFGTKCLARAATTAVVGLGLAAATPAVSAESFLDGKSNGMTRCVRAIFSTKEVKRINVHGHHFNCKPLGRPNARERVVQLSHVVRGFDDRVVVKFTVNTLSVMLPKSAKATVGHGPISTGSFVSSKKADQWVQRYVAGDYATIANKALRIAPKETPEWQRAAGQIAAVVIAEVGRPRLPRIPASEVNCTLPTFFEHENFRGRRFSVRTSEANLAKMTVGGERMVNKISSLCLPRGWIVTVYSGPDFTRRSHTFTGHAAHDDLQRLQLSSGRFMNWADRIFSIRVNRKGPLSRAP